jgi:hypothetical protein
VTRVLLAFACVPPALPGRLRPAGLAGVRAVRFPYPRRVNQMDQKREAEVELYKAYSIEEIIERRELFGTSPKSKKD